MVVRGENKSCRNFSAPEIGNAFAYSYATRGAMDKRRWQADSAHQRGPETTLQDILIVVESGGTGWRIKAGGIFHSQKLGTLSPVCRTASQCRAVLQCHTASQCRTASQCCTVLQCRTISQCRATFRSIILQSTIVLQPTVLQPTVLQPIVLYHAIFVPSFLFIQHQQSITRMAYLVLHCRILVIELWLRYFTRIRWTFGENSVKFGENSVNIRWEFSEHSVRIQWTFFH